MGFIVDFGKSFQAVLRPQGIGAQAQGMKKSNSCMMSMINLGRLGVFLFQEV